MKSSFYVYETQYDPKEEVTAEKKTRVQVLLTHPELGGCHFTTDIDMTVPEYRKHLKELGCKIGFIEEVEESK